MIKDAGFDWVVLGHSERRSLPEIMETDEVVATKTAYAVEQGVWLCTFVAVTFLFSATLVCGLIVYVSCLRVGGRLDLYPSSPEVKLSTCQTCVSVCSSLRCAFPFGVVPHIHTPP